MDVSIVPVFETDTVLRSPESTVLTTSVPALIRLESFVAKVRVSMVATPFCSVLKVPSLACASSVVALPSVTLLALKEALPDWASD